jgi:hypothetical protein
VLLHRKRRRARFVQNPKLLDHHFHFAGRYRRVHSLRVALGDHTLTRDYIFRRKQIDFRVQIGRIISMKDELRYAIAIAQPKRADSRPRLKGGV